jgi:hypothetical protein
MTMSTENEMDRIAQHVADKMDIAIERVTPVVDQMTHEIVVRGVVMGIVWLIVCATIAAFCWWATYHVMRADQEGFFKSRGSTPYVGMILFIVSGIVSTCFAIAKPMEYLYEVCAPGLTLFDHVMAVCK